LEIEAMTKPPFIATANALLAWYRPCCTSLAFDPHKQFGHFVDELGAPHLNVGVAGALLMLSLAEEATERDVDAVFPHSFDREEFWRWARGLKHSVDGTIPEWGEQEALKGGDEQANAELYRLMGLLMLQQ
jgi:hypothetical protein